MLCEWRQGTGCTVLTLSDSQLAVPASNSTLCGYVLEYYSALFVCLSQLMFVILPLSTVNVTGCTVLTLCDGQLAVPASNCTLCGYVLEYYSALFVCLSS